jgi:tetratricopeptide (TPR) repeat protein
MSRRWTESELRFIRDNSEKMSVQSLADALSVRIDELEKRMEKLALGGASGAPAAAKKPLTMKELSRHTENARKDFDRGVAALQKKKFEEAERNFVDLIQKYPDEKELVDRARVYRAVCERQKRAVNPALEPEDFYYAAVLEKNRGNVPEAIEHLKRAARKNGGGRVDFLLACCYAQSGDSVTALEHLRKAIEEDQRHRILARHDRDFDPVRDSPEFQDLLAS